LVQKHCMVEASHVPGKRLDSQANAEAVMALMTVRLTSLQEVVGRRGPRRAVCSTAQSSAPLVLPSTTPYAYQHTYTLPSNTQPPAGSRCAETSEEDSRSACTPAVASQARRKATHVPHRAFLPQKHSHLTMMCMLSFCESARLACDSQA
jgi:hypothetical protein